MIDFIHGILSELTPASAVVEAGGVGYSVNIALNTYSTLVGVEGEIKLYTTEIIREDTHELYGFLNRGERALFELLLSVNGVGANTARMILSTYSAAEIRQIVATGNARALSQVKGLGPKTAQRIIVDLKDKVLKIDLGIANPDTPTLAGTEPQTNPTEEEAVSALTALGFSPSASAKAAEKILHDEPSATVEHVIRLALKML